MSLDLNLIKLPSVSEIVRSIEKKIGFESELKWKTVISITTFHTFGLYWAYWNSFPVKWQTTLWAWIMFVLSGMGITCGAHRLWTHRSYKATVALKVFLIMCFASAGQNSIYDWVRDHRLHHKFTDTEADPHNVRRGFIFSHIGWLMMKKKDQVLEKGKLIDMSDIVHDKLIMFERKYTKQLSYLFCFFLPTLLPILCWGEEWKCAISWICFIRFFAVLHVEMTVNSLAHMYGYKPYNKNITPRQNLFVSLVTFGEGWHNYHHVFPYDYKASETFELFDWSTFFLKCFSALGVAYDFKEPSPELIQSVISRLNSAEMVSDFNEY